MLIKIAMIVGAMGFSLLTISNAQAQENEKDLRDVQITINVQEKPLWDVMMKLTDVYDIPIGLEQSTLDPIGLQMRFSIYKPDQSLGQAPLTAERRQYLLQSGIELEGEFRRYLFTVQYENAPLSTVLDDLVKQMKNYDWEINNGVVNIFPVHGRDPRFEKLMDLRISKFSLANGFRFDEFKLQSKILYQLPELREFMRVNGFRPKPKCDAYWTPIHPSFKEEIALSEVTFKELLNAIVRVKRGGWILTRGRKTPDGSQELLHLFI